MAKSDKFSRVKRDVTPYLFHFTKGPDAIDVLRKIIDEERLVSQKHSYICFTASPLTSLLDFFDTKVNSTGEPMYQPFGIGFSKKIMYEKYGARNVVYSTLDEIKSYNEQCPELSWRCEELDIEKHDFSYLREWRVNGREFSFEDFPKDEMIIVAKSRRDLEQLVEEQDFDVDFEEFEPGEAYPTIIRKEKRAFKGFCLSEVQEHKDDHSLSASTKSQKIGEAMGIACGGNQE